MNAALTVEKVRADLLAEQADLDAIVADLSDRTVGAPDAQPGLDGGRSDRSSDVLRRHRGDRHHRPRGVHRDGRPADGGDGIGRVDRCRSDARRGASDDARRTDRSLAHEPPAPRRGVVDTRRRRSRRLVRPVDGRQVVPHRSPDGDVGPRPGRRRRARHEPAADRSSPAHRAARIHHPRLELPQPSPRDSRRRGRASN